MMKTSRGLRARKCCSCWIDVDEMDEAEQWTRLSGRARQARAPDLSSPELRSGARNLAAGWNCGVRLAHVWGRTAFVSAPIGQSGALIEPDEWRDRRLIGWKATAGSQ